MTAVGQALAAVIAELPGIGKGDRSPEGYQYRGIEAITKHVQPLLAKHGVVFIPKATVNEVRPSPAMKEGWQDVYMTVEWTIVGPDGSTLLAQTQGIGRDRADKGANKAMTQAFKYLLLDVLCIADAKDDADGQTYEHDRYERQEVPPPPAGWKDHDECSAAHADLQQTVKASSEEVQAHMKTWRNAERLPWPMPRNDLERMWAELATVQAPADDTAPFDTPNELEAKARAIASKARAKAAS